MFSSIYIRDPNNRGGTLLPHKISRTISRTGPCVSGQLILMSTVKIHFLLSMSERFIKQPGTLQRNAEGSEIQNEVNRE